MVAEDVGFVGDLVYVGETFELDVAAGGFQAGVVQGFFGGGGGFEVAEAGDLDVAIADGGDLLHGGGEIGLGKTTDGVKLDGYWDVRHVPASDLRLSDGKAIFNPPGEAAFIAGRRYGRYGR